MHWTFAFSRAFFATVLLGESEWWLLAIMGEEMPLRCLLAFALHKISGYLPAGIGLQVDVNYSPSTRAICCTVASLYMKARL